MDEYGGRGEMLEKVIDSLNNESNLSRRQFLKISGISIVGISTLEPFLAGANTKPVIIMEQAEGVVISDPTKCVGCRRCELACTEFNEGKAHPDISRIKVGRNVNYGPKSVYAGEGAQGNWGGGLVVQDLCKQCPHPVPCANACPNDAIVIGPPLNARVVDLDKCIGCKMCLRACPWEMISYDSETNKATKCFLCQGKPKCVEACPASALHYTAWNDYTNKIPPRVVPTSVMPPEKAAACNLCHKK
jgi:Fe-S-cluster-containing dehydrogenase component